MKKKVDSGIKNQKKKKEKSGDFYFDDCLICQTMDKAEKEGKSLSVEDLKDVFQKTNEQN